MGEKYDDAVLVSYRRRIIKEMRRAETVIGVGGSGEWEAGA